MNKMHKKVCKTLNCIGHLFILVSTITRCVSISAFPTLAGISLGILGSPIGLKVCVMIAAIKKYVSIIKKRKKSMIKLFC